MRKWIAVLLTVIMSLSLFVGCGGSTNSGADNGNQGDASVDNDAGDVNPEGDLGIQTVRNEESGLKITYDGDGIREAFSSVGCGFNELSEFSGGFITNGVTITDENGCSIQRQIVRYQNYDFMENVVVSTPEIQFINNIMVYYYTVDYTNSDSGEAEGNAYYFIPLGYDGKNNMISLNYQVEFDLEMRDKTFTDAFMKSLLIEISCQGEKPIGEENRLTLTDASGTPVCNLYLVPTIGRYSEYSTIKVISNENGHVVLEYSGVADIHYDEREVVRTIEMDVNKYSSIDEFFTAQDATRYASTLEYDNLCVDIARGSRIYFSKDTGYGTIEMFAVELEDGTILTAEYTEGLLVDILYGMLFTNPPELIQ